MLLVGKLLLCICTSMILNVNIPSESMENTLECNSSVIAVKTNIMSNIKRKDIIIFDCKIEDKIMIKRVIGLPGEHITISEGKIYVNDSEEPIKEDYIKENWTEDNSDYEFDIPAGVYFVMGDNRNDSLDSRHWNGGEVSYVNREDIIAKAVFKYKPIFEVLSYNE